MPTTFQVIFLGTGPTIDPFEGDDDSERADLLLGTTFGDPSDPLFGHVQMFSPVFRGNGQPDYPQGIPDVYDTDNRGTNDRFRIDDGRDQIMDGTVIYNATLTYADSTTAEITAVVFQDTRDRLYLAPEESRNADQAALEAKPIQSITLNSIADRTTNLTADRVAGEFVICFAEGTAIGTPGGEVPVEDLRPGDLVETLDRGPMPLRWVGRTVLGCADLDAAPNKRPVRIPKGRLGNRRDLLVSPQHGLLLGDRLVRARHLAETPGTGIRVARGKRRVSYFHLLFDTHEIVFAEGAPSESYYPGPMGQRMLSAADRLSLAAFAPRLVGRDMAGVEAAYGPTARPFLRRRDVAAAWARYVADKGCTAQASGT